MPSTARPVNGASFIAYNAFEHIVDQAMVLGLRAVKLTGGEPLLHPQLPQMIQRLTEKGIQLRLETNATLLTRETTRLLADAKQPFVAVSLDGHVSDIHDSIRRVQGCFRQAIEGLQMLVECGVHVQLVMTVMRSNRGSVHQMVMLARELEVRALKLNVLQPAGRGAAIVKNCGGLSIHEWIELGREVEDQYGSETTPRVHFDHPPAFVPLARLVYGDRKHTHGCGIFHILGVLSDGSYALCGVGERHRELVCGRADTDPLSLVWSESKLLRQIREGLPQQLEGVCSRCLHQRSCLGMCVAQNYLSTGRLFGPNWYCAAAADAGVFPESRLVPAASSCRKDLSV